MDSASTDVTIYIGRFSPFHLGHAHVLKQALERSKLVIVLIGSSGLSRSLKNPFTFQERRRMIMAWFDDYLAMTKLPTSSIGALAVIESRDFPYNDTLWNRNVQRLVKQTISSMLGNDPWVRNAKIELTGSDRDETTWYLQMFPQWKQSFVEPYRQNGSVNVSATDVRTWLFSGIVVKFDCAGHAVGIEDTLPISTREYLESFRKTEHFKSLVATYNHVEKYRQAWGKAPYPPIFQTVDAVVVQSGHVLTVVRGHEPGKGLWALPGGFVNQNERLRAAAIRELLEETGIRLAEGKQWKKITTDILKGSIRGSDVFDKPDRSDRGRTITNAFLFRLDDTKPLPKVRGSEEGNNDTECDVTSCFWLPINEALERMDMWFEDHHAIIEMMIGQQDL